ncbi:MAG: hypothetical protein D3924_01920 [Candidatus Electrothrix sp. AR4]|nr:hypothetical protein [Candidatus Electrothrix sp. AR4]
MNSLKLHFSWKHAAITSIAALLGIFMPQINAVAAKKIEAEQIVATKTIERPGTVDSVGKESFIINDMVVRLKDSVLLYDQHGKKAYWKSFQIGDQVTITSFEDEAVGTLQTVSISRTQAGKPEKQSSNQKKTKRKQTLHKVNGVWTN